MQFYKTDGRSTSPPSNATYPCVVLNFDRWNDYSLRTQFDLYYCPVAGTPKACGSVKILHSSGSSTHLAESFTSLDDTFCSLGQSIKYYRHLDFLGERIKAEILIALRDIVYRRELAEPFKQLPAFQSSLLRFSEAAKLYEEGLEAFDFAVARATLAVFSFSSRLAGASADHSVSFNFQDRLPLPGRIIAFIGTNGTGKTRYLERLADAVVYGPNADLGDSFSPLRPRFSRVITISYSAFDEFRIPPPDVTTMVIHCGIHDSHGVLKDLSALASEIRSNLDTAYQITRMDSLARSLQEILPESVVNALTHPAVSFVGPSFPDISELKLSSGQLVLLSILSSLAVNIEPDSLVLFDEPEMHLHPNAIGGLMRAINTAMAEFRSYAVMATHSPLILQQLPGRYVRVFRRVDSTPVIDTLPVEGFAENLTAITEEIFHAAEGPTLYGEWIREMLETKSLDEIGQLFDGGLSFNARTLVRSLDSQRRATS